MTMSSPWCFMCHGGGPLFCLDPTTRAQFLAGVTSHAVGCGNTPNPDMYTAVHRYVDNFIIPNSVDQLPFI